MVEIWDVEELILEVAKGNIIFGVIIQKHLDYYSKKLNEVDIKVLIGIGVCEMLKKNYLKASKQFGKALKINSDSPLLWLAIGLNAVKSGNFLFAEKSFLTVLEQGKYLEIVSTLILDCYVELKSYQKAIECFEKFLQPTQRHYCCIGFCYERLNDLTSAINYYKKENSNELLSVACEGYSSYLKSHYDEALETFKHLIDASPLYSQAWIDSKFLYSLYYIITENYRRSIIILSSILIENPHLFIYLCTLGKISYKLHNLSESFSFYLKANKANSRQPEIWFNLAVLYQKAQQIDYKSALEKARILDLNKTLPEKFDENSELLDIKLNISKFGCGEVSKANQEKLREMSGLELKSIGKIAVSKPVKIKKINRGMPLSLQRDWEEFTQGLSSFLANKNEAEKTLPQKRLWNK